MPLLRAKSSGTPIGRAAKGTGSSLSRAIAEQDKHGALTRPKTAPVAPPKAATARQSQAPAIRQSHAPSGRHSQALARTEHQEVDVELRSKTTVVPPSSWVSLDEPEALPCQSTFVASPKSRMTARVTSMEGGFQTPQKLSPQKQMTSLGSLHSDTTAATPLYNTSHAQDAMLPSDADSVASTRVASRHRHHERLGFNSTEERLHDRPHDRNHFRETRRRFDGHYEYTVGAPSREPPGGHDEKHAFDEAMGASMLCENGAQSRKQAAMAKSMSDPRMRTAFTDRSLRSKEQTGRRWLLSHGEDPANRFGQQSARSPLASARASARGSSSEFAAVAAGVNSQRSNSGKEVHSMHRDWEGTFCRRPADWQSPPKNNSSLVSKSIHRMHDPLEERTVERRQEEAVLRKSMGVKGRGQLSPDRGHAGLRATSEDGAAGNFSKEASERSYSRRCRSPGRPSVMDQMLSPKQDSDAPRDISGADLDGKTRAIKKVFKADERPELGDDSFAGRLTVKHNPSLYRYEVAAHKPYVVRSGASPRFVPPERNPVTGETSVHSPGNSAPECLEVGSSHAPRTGWQSGQESYRARIARVPQTDSVGKAFDHQGTARTVNEERAWRLANDEHFAALCNHTSASTTRQKKLSSDIRQLNHSGKSSDVAAALSWE